MHRCNPDLRAPEAQTEEDIRLTTLRGTFAMSPAAAQSILLCLDSELFCFFMLVPFDTITSRIRSMKTGTAQTPRACTKQTVSSQNRGLKERVAALVPPRIAPQLLYELPSWKHIVTCVPSFVSSGHGPAWWPTDQNSPDGASPGRLETVQASK